jgi:hypothetical protein
MRSSVSTVGENEEIDFCDDEKNDEKNEKKNGKKSKKKQNDTNEEKIEKNGKKGEKGVKGDKSKVSPRDVVSPPRNRVFLSVEKAMMVCSEVLAITLGLFILIVFNLFYILFILFSILDDFVYSFIEFFSSTINIYIYNYNYLILILFHVFILFLFFINLVL